MTDSSLQKDNTNPSGPEPRKGKLFIVPTPVGNLKDISFRALEVLQEADLILAEDTRHSIKLLNHFKIIRPLTPYHQHNEHQVLQHLVNQLLEGKRMAMVSDAGTPGISDAGFLLVRECLKLDIPVETLPGPTAFVPALINSGLPANRFCFEGFLPVKKGRQTLLRRLADEERTLIFYESPHRLIRTLEEMIPLFGPGRACSVSRELSKLHEENFHGSLQSALDHFSGNEIKGELVLVVAGRS